ncbi:hypothetical protein Nepgr_006293 [Nepenthes gracilis]|uniref:Uncharacterized protein n=1 Tax=Nepenthes gracilis TaxID=150966 RepID=A0AAD3XH76_NEPGR|nr:hypothetical protein Nepgr_006293 [Nepenthes gracilis]
MSQVAAMRETLKRKEAEIEHLKRQLEKPVKLWRNQCLSVLDVLTPISRATKSEEEDYSSDSQGACPA